MAAGEVLHDKKQAAHRSVIATDLLVSRGDYERAGHRAKCCFPSSSNHGETGGMKRYRWCISSSSSSSSRNSMSPTAFPLAPTNHHNFLSATKMCLNANTFSRKGSKYYQRTDGKIKTESAYELRVAKTNNVVKREEENESESKKTLDFLPIFSPSHLGHVHATFRFNAQVHAHAVCSSLLAL